MSQTWMRGRVTILFAIVFLSFVAFHHFGAGECEMANVTTRMREQVTIHSVYLDDFVAYHARLVPDKCGEVMNVNSYMTTVMCLQIY